MMWKRPTYRLVDGERVDGVWCHVWVKRYSGYHVDDLFAYADGLLRCGESFDLRGLRQWLESGKIALRDPERPVPERPAQTPRWSARYPEPLTNQGFLGEVADEIEALNGRPTTSDRPADYVGPVLGGDQAVPVRSCRGQPGATGPR